MRKERENPIEQQATQDPDFNSKRYWGKVGLSFAVGGTIALLAKKAEASPVVALARHISSSGHASEPATDGLDLKNNDGFTGELNHMDVRLFRKLIPSHETERKKALGLWDDVKTYDGDIPKEITTRHPYPGEAEFVENWKLDPKQLSLTKNIKGVTSLGQEVFFPYPWSKENSQFLHSYLIYMYKFFNSLLGAPSKEMVQWLGNRPDNIPVFPYIPFYDTEPALGYANIPPVGSPPNNIDVPYGLFVELNPERTMPSLDIITHEALHSYIGLDRIPMLEAKGYGEWGHNFMDSVSSVIRGEAFGYSLRDDRGLMVSDRSIKVIKPTDPHSPYNISERNNNPLLWDYLHGNKSVFRDTLES